MLKKKFVLYLIFILIIPFFCPYTANIVAFAYTDEDSSYSDLSEEVEDQLGNLDFSALEDVVDQMQESETSLFDLDDIYSELLALINGETTISIIDILDIILDLFFGSLNDYSTAFILIFAIGVLSGLIGKIKGKFAEKSIKNIIHFVCMSLIIVVLATSISNLSTSIGICINNIKLQMEVLFPILLTLTLALGGVSSVAVYQPAIAILTSGVSAVFTYFILPIFILYFVFGIIGNLSNNVKLDNFNKFFMSVFRWTIGLVFTVFFAFISVQGITAGSFDSVSLRTAKYTISSYIPIMGSYLSDGMDLILSSTLLIKNGVGVIGLLLLFSSIIIPIINIAIFNFVLKLLSAILQPLTDSRICKLLENTSKSLSILLTCIIAISFMYFIVIGLIMCTTNTIIL